MRQGRSGITLARHSPTVEVGSTRYSPDDAVAARVGQRGGSQTIPPRLARTGVAEGFDKGDRRGGGCPRAGDGGRRAAIRQNSGATDVLRPPLSGCLEKY